MFHATNFTESTEAFETLERLMKTAAAMQEYLRQNETSNIDMTIVNFAQDAYLQRTGKVPEEMPEKGFLDTQHATLWTIVASRMHWLVRWGSLAYPRFQTSHSFAAMLMATTISPKEIPSIEAPWPAFMVEIPEGLLPIATKDGTMTHITRVYVNTSFLPSAWTEPWWSFEFVGKGIEIHRVGRVEEAFDPSSKTDLKNRPMLKFEGPRTQPLDAPVGNYDEFWDGYDRSQEDRVVILAARLVLGLCIMMTDKANVKEKASKLPPDLAQHRRRFGFEPTSNIFVVGRPVKVDFRLAVKAYVEGGTKSLSVQSLVAGHHKFQPHGPGRSLRKWIFVEPYWRGPEDAPILVRPHTTSGVEDQ